jgi:hypothetical protein
MNDNTLPGAAPLVDDLLKGAEQISKFIGENVWRTYHLLETQVIPAGKQGNYWIASKQALREHYERLTRGQAT